MGDLRDLLADPRRVDELTPVEAASALVQLASLQVALAAQLRAGPTSTDADLLVPASDRLLTAEDVAGRFGRSVAWVYRQAKHWTFTRRVTRRTLRFSEAGLSRWVAAQRGRDGRRRTGYLVTETGDRGVPTPEEKREQV